MYARREDDIEIVKNNGLGLDRLLQIEHVLMLLFSLCSSGLFVRNEQKKSEFMGKISFYKN